MKESDLKETESKQVVIATYAMAAEGLDIKSLTTLFLATPRTDITQAVGRILRMKHERPLVVDFIDTHDLFQNQSKKRLTYYRKCKYSVKRTDSVGYMQGKWRDVKAGTQKKSAPKAGACLIDI
jgi:superfamily II DNA or RNA helicase